MGFLIDEQRKIILGWSPKCGCSHIKNIFLCLQNDLHMAPDIHNEHNMQSKLPPNIEGYCVFIVLRDPYKRLVSGFVDKYKKDGQFRHKWNKDISLTFTHFVNELTKENWEAIDRFHFNPQTEGFDGSGFVDERLNKCKEMIVCDIENVNYDYIESKFNKKIPDHQKRWIGPHQNSNRGTGPYDEDNHMYDYTIDDYSQYRIPHNKFYNKELFEKVSDFYRDDILFSREHGFEYGLEKIKDKIEDTNEDKIEDKKETNVDSDEEDTIIIETDDIIEIIREIPSVNTTSPLTSKPTMKPTTKSPTKSPTKSTSNPMTPRGCIKPNTNYLYHEKQNIILVWQHLADCDRIMKMYIEQEKIKTDHVDQSLGVHTIINTHIKKHNIPMSSALNSDRCRIIQFCVNPYKRVISSYLYFIFSNILSPNSRRNCLISFEEFVNRLLKGTMVSSDQYNSQTFFSHKNNNIDVHHIEDIEHTLSCINSEYSLDYKVARTIHTPVPPTHTIEFIGNKPWIHLYTESPMSYISFYDENIRTKVSSIYKEDLKNLHYTWGMFDTTYGNMDVHSEIYTIIRSILLLNTHSHS